MSDEDTATAVVLDVLAHGRSDDDRPRYQRDPLCYVLSEADLQPYELVFESSPDVSIGDVIVIEPLTELPNVRERNRIGYDDLSAGARSELEYLVEELIEDDEDRFVDFFNRAQPISLRLHQLNLLPGIGDKLRDGILEERSRQPFESFDDLEERVTGLHDPRGIIIERIMDELRDGSLKYHLFVGPDALLVRG